MPRLANAGRGGKNKMPKELIEYEQESIEAPGIPEMPEKPGMTEGEVCVPLKALSQPDDAEQLQAPEEGDNVTMTVDAVVTRIEGDNAYLKPVSINGTDLEAEKKETPAEPTLDDQEAVVQKNLDDGGGWI